MSEITDDKIKNLWNHLISWYEKEGIEKAVVAYSGGKDSTLVLDSALEAIDDVKAIIFDAEIFPEWETENAIEKAEELGVGYELIKTSKLDIKNFSKNPINRCYYCKKDMFEQLKEIEDKVILEGTNADEVKGHRPGLRAVEEFARSPLLEVGIGEEAVRSILKWRGKKVWERPSFACLATRFPTDHKITEEGLKRIERVENKIFDLGVEQLRVRDFGDTARIEVYPKDMDIILNNREKIVELLVDEGYKEMFLDLEGYRTGSISPKD